MCKVVPPTRLLAALVAAILLVVALPAARAQTNEIYLRPIQGFNPSIRKTRIDWESGESTITYGLEEKAGRIAVCGLVIHDGRIDRRAYAGAMANSGIGTGGYEVMTDLRYFREFIPPDRLLLACMITNYQWNPQYATLPAELIFRGEFIDPKK